MPRGPKPMPTHLKLVTGNRGRRRLPENEPDVSSECPEPPAHLVGPALDEWHNHASTLHSVGILTKTDRAVLAAYCQLYGRWVEAELALAAHRKRMIELGDDAEGFLTSTPNGANMQHPLVGVANTAARDMVRYAAELGLTPSARTRVTAAPKARKADPAAKYF